MELYETSGSLAGCFLLVALMGEHLFLCCFGKKKKKKTIRIQSDGGVVRGSSSTRGSGETSGSYPDDDGDYMNMPHGGLQELQQQLKKKKKPKSPTSSSSLNDKTPNSNFVREFLKIEGSDVINSSKQLPEEEEKVASALDPAYATLANVQDGVFGEVGPKEAKAQDPAYQTMANMRDEEIWGKKADDPAYMTLAGVKDEEIWGTGPKLKQVNAQDPAYQTLANIKDEDIWGNRKKPPSIDAHDPAYMTLANVSDEVFKQ